MHTPLTIVIAGSTHHTSQCAQALLHDKRFTIVGIITPTPKPSGRKKEIKNNPLHEFAINQDIPVLLVGKKIDETLHTALTKNVQAPDILLVIDFGYIVPPWLLDWPKIGPVNIHPSDLPKYRGSSPGQFALLFGEAESAITVMRMDEKLDHGSIITKIFFEIEPTWTSIEYYSHAFSLIAKDLSTILYEFCQTQQKIENQSDESPTPTARMLTREDGFVPLETLKSIVMNAIPTVPVPFLASYAIKSTSRNLYNMWRGLTPWPGIWTHVEKNGKKERVKVLKMSKENEKLLVETVQFEGKLPEEYKEHLL